MVRKHMGGKAFIASLSLSSSLDHLSTFFSFPLSLNIESFLIQCNSNTISPPATSPNSSHLLSDQYYSRFVSC